jgi:hypothetical protein
MAITVTNLTPETFGFCANGFSADVSATEEVVAAPGTGKSHYLRHVTISSGGAISVTLGAGETGGAVTSAILGPISFAANQTIKWDFNPAIKLPVNKSITVDSSGAGNVLVFVQGHTS